MGIAAVGVVLAVVVGMALPFTREQFLAHWWVFPASVAFSFVALAAGVSGALLFILPAVTISNEDTWSRGYRTAAVGYLEWIFT